MATQLVVRQNGYTLNAIPTLLNIQHCTSHRDNHITDNYNGTTIDGVKEEQKSTPATPRKDNLELQQELFDAGILCIYDIMNILEGE